MFYFTSLCIPIAKAEEGAPTEMAGTVAADSNPLDLFVDSTVALPGLKGNHLDNSEMEKRLGWEEKRTFQQTPESRCKLNTKA